MRTVLRKRIYARVATLFVLLALPSAAAADPTVQVDYANPGLSPSQWTLTLHRDGTGHFRSQMGKAPAGELHGIETPSVDRDIQVSPEFAQHVFDEARRHSWFNQECESHLKVAFQGWEDLHLHRPARSRQLHIQLLKGQGDPGSWRVGRRSGGDHP